MKGLPASLFASQRTLKSPAKSIVIRSNFPLPRRAGPESRCPDRSTLIRVEQ
jgi:hypothetical protein